MFHDTRNGSRSRIRLSTVFRKGVIMKRVLLVIVLASVGIFGSAVSAYSADSGTDYAKHAAEIRRLTAPRSTAKMKCPLCNGTGFQGYSNCNACNGTGRIG